VFVRWCAQTVFKSFLRKAAYGVGNTANRDSLWAEVEKYNQPVFEPSRSVKMFAQTALAILISRVSSAYLSDGVQLELLSPQEAVEMMNLNTSPGFPWRAKHHKKIGLLSDPVMSKLLFERVDWVWKNLKKPALAFRHVWFSFLKEELRPLEKLRCLPPKIRSICGAPFDLSIVGNQICGHFNKVFYKCCEKPGFGSCVGVTPFHGGWDRLWVSMFENPEFPRPNAASVDAAQWDRKYCRHLFDLVIALRVGVTDLVGTDELSEATRLLSSLYSDVINLCIAVPSSSVTNLVAKRAGMPSGWIGTTSDNTLGHIIVVVSFLISIGLKDEIGRAVEFKLYGDDNLIAWSDSVDHLISADKLKSWYAQWGFVLHDVTIVRGSALRDLVFLGGKFGVCPMSGTRVYVPSDPQKGFDSMRFKFKSMDSAFERACAIRCLHFYNDAIYQVATKYAAHLLREGLVSRGLASNFLSEAQLLHIHTGTECGYLEGDGPLNSPIPPDFYRILFAFAHDDI